MPVTAVYALEDAPEKYERSIFAAGPTPRKDGVESWRGSLLQALEKEGYDGVVFIPEDRSGKFHGDYDHQIGWEKAHLELADCILFWIPRDLETLPGFTTNVEFGTWQESGKVVLGAPKEAPKNTYLFKNARAGGIPVAHSLEDTVKLAMEMTAEGAARRGGEREVPLRIWNCESFQQWYSAQQGAGNSLVGAKVEYVFPKTGEVFAWALHAALWVGAEGRVKDNEVVFSRTPVTSVLAWGAKEDGERCVVLVREVRVASSGPDGYVWELPGGSSPHKNQSEAEVAAEELYEETGLRIPAARLTPCGSRQLAPTFSAHRSSLFSVELSSEELADARRRAGQVNGVGGERCELIVMTLSQLLTDPGRVDRGTLGMVMQVLAREENSSGR